MKLGLTSFEQYDLLVTDYRLIPDENMRNVFAQAAATTPAAVAAIPAEALEIYAAMFKQSGAEHLQGLEKQITINKPIVMVAKIVEDYLNAEEIEAIIQHEVGHIINKDLNKVDVGFLNDIDAELAADAYAASVVSKQAMRTALVKITQVLTDIHAGLVPIDAEEYQQSILDNCDFKRRLLALC